MLFLYLPIIINRYEKKFFVGICFLVTLFSNAQTHQLLFETNYGNFKVVLYDFTPNHRDLILNAIDNEVYQNIFFNRIIENFVVQGGEHDDDIAKHEVDLPLEKRKRLLPEFDVRAFHKIGALGAGRDENIDKASFLNQIYFVVGKPVQMEDLEVLQAKKGIVFSDEQIQTYLTQGGLPRLDGDYTVFGEVIEGFDVLMKISKVKTNKDDTPLQTIEFKIKN